MSGLIETHPLVDGEPPRRARIPQRLSRPPDPVPTTEQLIERDPVLKALAATGIVAAADMEWLARTGRAYRGVTLPWFIHQEPEGNGRCFDIADALSERWGLTYVAGFGLPPDIPNPLPHAWGGDGRSAIDPSWRDQTACRYFGIAGRDRGNTQKLYRIGCDLHVAYGIEKPRKVLWAGLSV